MCLLAHSNLRHGLGGRLRISFRFERLRNFPSSTLAQVHSRTKRRQSAPKALARIVYRQPQFETSVAFSWYGVVANGGLRSGGDQDFSHPRASALSCPPFAVYGLGAAETLPT